MTTDTIKKIKAHLIEFPNDKPADIAKVFEVPVVTVYDAKESLRRHKMLPRVLKLKRRKPKSVKADAIKSIAKVDNSVSVLRYELASLRAERDRLKAIIEYLESAAGIRKAA